MGETESLLTPIRVLFIDPNEGAKCRHREESGLRPVTTTVPVVSEPLHRALGLTDEEAEQIDRILARPANGLELAMYSVMWSEHCS